PADVADFDSTLPTNDQDFADNGAFVDAFEELLHATPSSSSQSRVYVVFKGQKPGIYETWAACEDQVSGFSHNSFKSYPTLEEAHDAWNHSIAAHTMGPPGSSQAHLASLRSPINNRISQTLTPASPQRLATIHHRLRLRKTDEKSSIKQGDLRRNTADGQPSGVPSHDEESQWYAVIEGRRPGVYQGRSAAGHATGHGLRGVVRAAPSQQEANKIFVRSYMGSLVKRME
ncbi:hypothetical protein H0H92_007273, partial [Tricholoma furcatifolium]